MRILIAPDKFKGSLSAWEVGTAIRDGVLQVEPSATCHVVPLADGGEGTTDVLTHFSHGAFHRVEARDPLGRPVEATYGLSHDGRTAFLEMAAASGLYRLKEHERNPLLTGTWGTGDLIRHALDQKVEDICLGIGGSATNDGGMGAATALGVRFYDEQRNLLKGAGEDLLRIHIIDDGGLHPRMRKVRFTIFCDVDNPLFGVRGAAAVFGPQKGADASAVGLLDRGLRHYASVLQRGGYANSDFPGAGAGGGMPVGIAAFAHATIRSGIEYILDFVQLEQQVRQADLVVTGEGKLDEQTLSGKVVKGVGALAFRYGKPLWAVAGSSSASDEDLHALHIQRVISLVNAGTSVEEAVRRAAALIRDRVAEAFKKFQSP